MGIDFKRAYAIVRQTMPYVLYRIAIYGALCLGILVYLSILAIFGMVFGEGAYWILLIASLALATVFGLGGFIADFMLCRQRAGHIALIVELLTEGRFPEGISQMKWARGRIFHYFEGMTLLPKIRRLTRESIRSANEHLFDAATALPVAGAEGNARFARHIVNLSQGYVEEAAMAYLFRARNENVFESARVAVLLYCQTWKHVLSNAVWLTIFGYGFALCAALLYLIPLAIIASLMPETWVTLRLTLFAIGFFLGLASKWALFDPIASTITTINFLEESDLLTPDATLEKALESQSEAYREMKQKAMERTKNSEDRKETKRPRSRRAPKETPTE